MDAAGWDRRYSTEELVWSAEPNRFVAAETGGLAPGRALDLAAGEGRNTVWLAQQGWRVTAVDFSVVGIEKGRQLAERLGVGERIDWVPGDLLTWAPPPGAYDLIVMAYLHLPAEHLGGVIRRAAAGLAPGGAFLVVGHDRTNLERGVGGPQDPAVLYTPEELREEVEGAGLEVVKAGTVERQAAAGVALDTLLVATRPGTESDEAPAEG